MMVLISARRNLRDYTKRQDYLGLLVFKDFIEDILKAAKGTAIEHHLIELNKDYQNLVKHRYKQATDAYSAMKNSHGVLAKQVDFLNKLVTEQQSEIVDLKRKNFKSALGHLGIRGAKGR